MGVEDSFPAFYKSANEYSRQWQKSFLWLERVQLAMLVIAAAAANFGHGGLLVSAIAFSLAVSANAVRAATRADRRWWAGRAGAESAKTLSWRYCVRGAPFGSGNVDSESLLSRRLTEVAISMNELAPIGVAQAFITADMSAMRMSPLNERVESYRVERIVEQMGWYSTNAELNERLSTRWTIVSFASQGLGLVLAIGAIRGRWDFDFIGVCSAVGASATAWSAVKQHDVLARSYAYTSAELAQIEGEIARRTWIEDEWSDYVDDAEEAISREHTAWRASRGT